MKNSISYFFFHIASRKISIPVIISFVALFLVSSCTIESKIAKEYLERKDSIAIMFIRPTYLYLTSLKDYEIDNKDILDDNALDSTLMAKSLFLQHIDQSVFLNKYNTAFIDELNALGFNVFTEDQMDTFLTIADSSRFIISLAQLELEEYVYPLKDEQLIENVLYYKNIDLNALNVNSWYELTKMNDNSQEQQILFASHYIIDDYESNFKYSTFTGEVAHTYNVDSISMADIYYLGAYLGSKYAGYVYDYLMNMYIYNKLPDNVNPGVYYHYDRRSRRYYPSYDDRFIPMED